MCGIAGQFSFSARAPSRELLAAMIGQVRHRGPDGFGAATLGPVGLAHARLSIIDIAGGDQPIHNETRTVWVVFNGEIFNFIELRARLQAQGHRFYTRSDTEVIVHLYEEHGDAFVEHLNGQFAIALWDQVRRRLVLARDRVGIRPLLYARLDDCLLFASEAKSLFAHPSMPRRIDRQALGELFTFWSPLPPRTGFEGVNAVPPGHTLVVENDGRTRLTRYWDWQFPETPTGPFPTSLDDCAAALRDLLVDAVKLQLRADVPVGAYLSGGLDSAIIATLIRNFTDTPLRTFSIAFEDAEFDERGFQRELVDRLGTTHTQILCRRGDIGACFPRVIRHAELPVVRSAPAPLMLLSEAVRREGYKVVLTGEGADEVFGGYDLFKEAKIRRFWARQPDSSSRPRILERLYPYLKHSPARGRAFTHAFFGQGMALSHEPFFSHIPRWSTTQRIWQFFSRDTRAALGDWDAHAAIRGHLPSAAGRWSPLARDQYLEAHTLMTGYLLSSQGDRVAMANSVEGRVPFLDHRVIEFANALPPRFKLMGLKEKHVLKHAMRGLLPESIRTRTKQPYRAPDSQSFFVDGRPLDYVQELLGEARIAAAGFFDPAAVDRLLEKCRSGRAIGFGDNMAFMGILSTMLLDEHFVRGRALEPPARLAEPADGPATLELVP